MPKKFYNLLFNEARFEVEASTIGDVKCAEYGGVDITGYRIYQFGYLLPDDDSTR